MQHTEKQSERDYYIDIVMCVDVTAGMSLVLDEIKENVLSIYPIFVDEMEKENRKIKQLRLKIIAFRDYGCDDEPMVESPFYTLPDQTDAFKSFVASLEAKGGGDGPKNALEAIALALKSDWTTGGSRRRHVIFVFSDSPALPLGARSDCPNYPADLPKTLPQLGAWWEGTDQSFTGTYQYKAGRMIAFVPDTEPWTDMQAWNRYWPEFFSVGTAPDVKLLDLFLLLNEELGL